MTFLLLFIESSIYKLSRSSSNDLILTSDLNSLSSPSSFDLINLYSDIISSYCLSLLLILPSYLSFDSFNESICSLRILISF